VSVRRRRVSIDPPAAAVTLYDRLGFVDHAGLVVAADQAADDRAVTADDDGEGLDAGLE
jgi:hypothetical protein